MCVYDRCITIFHKLSDLKQHAFIIWPISVGRSVSTVRLDRLCRSDKAASGCWPGWISRGGSSGAQSTSQESAPSGCWQDSSPWGCIAGRMTDVPLLFSGCQLPSGSRGCPKFLPPRASPVWLLTSANPPVESPPPLCQNRVVLYNVK